MFETTDIYLAATLVACGLNIDEIRRLDTVDDLARMVFCFEETKRLKERVSDYMGGKLLLNPQNIWEAYRAIKKRLYK